MLTSPCHYSVTSFKMYPIFYNIVLCKLYKVKLYLTSSMSRYRKNNDNSSRLFCFYIYKPQSVVQVLKFIKNIIKVKKHMNS